MREVTTPWGLRVESWQAGDRILLSGVIYTARDAAHQRMAQEECPPGRDRQSLCGPSPAPPGRPIGSVGPTTSGRMDAFAPSYGPGFAGHDRQRERADSVVEAMRKYGCVYLAAIGGAGALLANVSRKLKLQLTQTWARGRLAACCGKDASGGSYRLPGGNLYQSEPPKYRKGAAADAAL